MQVASAYDTGLPDESVDVIFSMSLIHHLEIPSLLHEMLRILAKEGRVILKEPIRFSAGYARLRKLLPAREDVEISDYEHPLTRDELAAVCTPFQQEGLRYFRLPFIPLFQRFGPQASLWSADRWLIRHLPWVNRYATSVVVHLQR